MVIESLDHKGRGLGRIDNKITFVKDALPGEEVEIKIIKSKKKYQEAETINFIKKSSDRINPLCPYFKRCGGCQLQYYNYEKQLVFKENKIKNIVQRYLNEDIKVNSIVYDKSYSYRNKITLQVNDQIGLFEEGSNKVIKIDKCLICNDLINDSIGKLKNLPIDNINKIIIRAVEDNLLVIIEGSKDIDINGIYNVFENIVINDNGNYFIKKGSDYIFQHLNNLLFKISRDSFFQVNPTMTVKLYDKIKEICIKNHSKDVLDLYCGTGSISLYISDVVNKVKGIEINKNAIDDAHENKRNNRINNVIFECSDTSVIKINEYYDTIIVDPPRAGLNNQIINELLNSNSQNIIYVSCDPMTLVRDLKILSSKYRVMEVTPFDVFSNTYHLECVCLLKLR